MIAVPHLTERSIDVGFVTQDDLFRQRRLLQTNRSPSLRIEMRGFCPSPQEPVSIPTVEKRCLIYMQRGRHQIRRRQSPAADPVLQTP